MENCDIEKLLSFIWSDLVVELQQWYEMYCANENISDNKKTKYFLLKSLYASRQHVELMGTQA